MSICLVTGSLADLGLQPVANARVTFAMRPRDLKSASGKVVLSNAVSATTDAAGDFSIEVLPGVYTVLVDAMPGFRGIDVPVPDAGTANLAALIGAMTPPELSVAEQAAADAIEASIQAAGSATSASEDAAAAATSADAASESAGITTSASLAAIAARDAAEGARNTALAAAESATVMANASGNSATASLAAREGAEAAQSGAEDAQTAAQAARTGAEQARDASVASKDDAVQAATNASGSAQAASTSAGSAQGSAQTASDAAAAAGVARDGAAAARDLAQAYRDTALGARDGAVAAQVASETARNASQAAQNAAETAQSGAVAAKEGSDAARDVALAARDKAQGWADAAEDVPVEGDPDRFSAKHWAAKSAESAGLSVNVPTLASQIGTLAAVLGQADRRVEDLEVTQGDGAVLRGLVLELATVLGQISGQINGGRAALTGGNLADPALRIGSVGIYSSAANTLSIAIAGSEVARFTSSGLTVFGTITES